MLLPLTSGDFYIHPAENTQESLNSKINERIKTDKRTHSNDEGPCRRVQHTEPGEENRFVTLKTCILICMRLELLELVVWTRLVWKHTSMCKYLGAKWLVFCVIRTYFLHCDADKCRDFNTYICHSPVLHFMLTLREWLRNFTLPPTFIIQKRMKHFQLHEWFSTVPFDAYAMRFINWLVHQNESNWKRIA